MKPDSPPPLDWFNAQRGALEPPSDRPPLEQLGTQAEQLEARLHHLRTGISNLLQLQRLANEAPEPSPPHTAADASVNTSVNASTDSSSTPSPAADLATAQAELSRLQQAVDEFELHLASHLLSWQQLREPFWQSVRYGGLGLVGGWVLHWLVRQ